MTSLAAGLVGLAAFASISHASPGDDTHDVATANARAAGFAPANRLTDRLIGEDVDDLVVAQGSTAVENPTATLGGFLITHYGYVNDGPMVPALGSNVEGQKTEPDKNTYLVLKGQHGADAGYDYGRHFLYQGHENGRKDGAGQARAFLSRINLDADAAHRVTVLAANDKNGNPIPSIDGSTWDPFARVLLLTAEFGGAAAGGVLMATPDYPSTVTDMAGVMGRGGYEGIQADSAGQLWIVEDVGGPSGTVNNKAKQPNSFVYRFVPVDPTDLTLGGKLQALQAASLAHAGPIEFHSGAADSDILAQDEKDVHTYGLSFATTWVTIHDTAVDGFTAFGANALAKAKHCTPFKRPENGVFRPDRKFREFYFTETGDTNSLTQAGSTYGGFGGLLRLSQAKPEASTGTLTLLYNGDVTHTGFDNIGFLTEDLLLVAEDAGDLLHGQRNGLDSLWMLDAGLNYGAAGAPAPVRVLAEGRDASATTDAGLAGTAGFQNDGDNEITGIHVSDGDPTVSGLLGAQKPRPFEGSWRVFWTQQHGDNVTYEIIDCDHGRDRRDRDDTDRDGPDRDDRGH